MLGRTPPPRQIVIWPEQLVQSSIITDSELKMMWDHSGLIYYYGRAFVAG